MTTLKSEFEDIFLSGVRYENIEELCRFNRGKWIKASQLVPGPYPVITSGQHITEFHNEFNRSGETITIASSGAYAGFVNYWTENIYLSNAFSVESRDPTRLLPKFLFHFLKTKQTLLHELATGGGVPNVYGSDLIGMRIPVPPVTFQKLLIEILDEYIKKEAELEDELKAEIEARTLQFAHYQFELLQCRNKDFRELTLGSIGRIMMCKRVMKSETSENGDIPFFKIGTFGGIPNAFISQQKFDDLRSKYAYPTIGSLLLSAAGTIGKTVKFDGAPSYFQDSNIVWLDHDESLVLNDYLFHCFKIAKWITDKGSIPRLYNSNILKLKIRVPSLSDQKYFVDLLDGFESQFSALNSELHNELALRKRQNAAYREILFNYREVLA